MKKSNLILILGCLLFLSLSILFYFFPRNTFTSVLKNTRNISTIEIFGQKTINQRFKIRMTKLEKLYISLGANEKENYFDGNVEIILFKNKKEIYSIRKNYGELKDGIIRLDLPKGISVLSKDDFSFELKCRDCSESAPLILNASNEIEKNEIMSLDGKNKNKALSMTLYGYHDNYSYCLACFVIYCLMFFVFCFKNIQNSKKGLVKKYYVLEFILSIIFYFLIIDNLSNYLYLSKLSFLSFLFLIFIYSLLVYLIIFIIKSKNLQKEKFYLGIAIPIALGYAILIIPNYVADEQVHFTRAYNLVDDNVLSTSSVANVPNDFLVYNMGNIKDYSDLKYALSKGTNYNDETTFSSAGSYGGVLYFFADIGIFIGKIFSLPILITFYLSRIFNVSGMLFFGYFIIKLLPFGKNIALVYLLNPMYMHQGGSVSADSMVNSICLLFIASVLFFKQKKKIETKDVIFFTFLIVLVGFAKYIYIPLILLLLLLYKNKDSISKKNKKIILIGSIIAILLCLISVTCMYLLPASKTGTEDIAVGLENVGMFGQLKYILNNPSYAIRCIISTFYYKFHDYVVMFFGMSLGWLNIGVYYLWIWIYIFLFFSAPFIYNSNEFGYFDKKEKYFCNILSLFLSFLCILSMWLSWTSIGSVPIEGVQGRYFLPFILLPMLTISNQSNKVKIKNYNFKLFILMLIVHVGTFVSIISFFK